METILEINDTDLCPTCQGLDNDPPFENASVGGNSTEAGTSWSSFTLMGVITVFLIIIIIVTVIGNMLVIVAVCLERNLQNVANRLIVSLAFADLMVACFVMGPAAVYMISGYWGFGSFFCDLWTNVLSCSASILHLLAVALDRYWAVSRINWTVNRNKNHINLMILTVWAVAFLVSVAPLLGWKDKHFWERIEQHRCTVSPELSYQLFATVSTFYAPTTLLLLLYWKIWKTAKKRIRHRVGKTNNHKFPVSSNPKMEVAKTALPSTISAQSEEMSCHTATVETSSGSVVASPISPEEQEMEQLHSPISTCEDEESGINPSIGPADIATLGPPSSPCEISQASLETAGNDLSTSAIELHSAPKIKDLQKRKETLEAKRERKAAKTLAIVTGAFLACWCPFFVEVLVLALCNHKATICTPPDYVTNALQWLGYLNSSLNPIIYTVFNKEFRDAFMKILCGKQKRRRT